jgi:hypothetical protein
MEDVKTCEHLTLVKLIFYILIFCFLSVVTSPLILINAPVIEMACSEGMCCMAEEEMTCDVEDMECCPPGMCNPAQCAFCCFACPVTQDKIVIKVFDTDIKTNPAAEQFLRPGFTSECFQPPELA